MTFKPFTGKELEDLVDRKDHASTWNKLIDGNKALNEAIELLKICDIMPSDPKIVDQKQWDTLQNRVFDLLEALGLREYEGYNGN
jgi:hypothetical protein